MSCDERSSPSLQRRAMPRAGSTCGWRGPALVVAFVGFAPTYWLQLAPGTFVGSPLLHLHARVVLRVDALSCSCRRRSRPGGRVARHRAWGLLGISLATAMVLVGFAVANEVLEKRLAAGFGDRARAFHIASSSMITLFGGFVFAAIVYVRRPEIHKRLMLLATVSMLPPAIARLFFAVSVGMGPGLRPGLGPPRTRGVGADPIADCRRVHPRGRGLRRAHARPAASRLPYRRRASSSPSRFCAGPRARPGGGTRSRTSSRGSAAERTTTPSLRGARTRRPADPWHSLSGRRREPPSVH